MRKIFTLTLAAFAVLTAEPALAEDYFVAMPPRNSPRLSPPEMASLIRDAQAGVAGDQWIIANGYAYDRDGKVDEATVHVWRRKAAEQGYLTAEVDLATDYFWGLDGHADKVKAAEWIRRAADHGSFEGQRILGDFYFSGAGVPRDYGQAYVWYSLAATYKYADKSWLTDQIHDTASHMTGVQIKSAKAKVQAWRALPPEAGQAMAQAQRALYAGDVATALKIWTPQANEGNAAAQYQLGLLYASKAQFDRGSDTARGWFEKSAALGNPVAQYRVGISYFYGIDGAADRARGLAALRTSAERGVAEAQWQMGMLNMTGDDTVRDEAAGAAWYRRAAAQGLSQAQFGYAQARLDGRGVAADPADAYGWMLLAIVYEADADRIRQWTANADRLAATLTPDQISAAKQRVSAWKPVFEVPK